MQCKEALNIKLVPFIENFFPRASVILTPLTRHENMLVALIASSFVSYASPMQSIVLLYQLF